jgi:hypothetical protein
VGANDAAREVGGLLKEYIAESNHGGWDGYSRQDLTGIRKFLMDLMLYHENAGTNFATVVSSTNPGELEPQAPEQIDRLARAELPPKKPPHPSIKR